MSKLNKILIAVLVALVSLSFVSCGNPVAGKTFVLELFDMELSTYTFNRDGTYVETELLTDEVYQGNYVFKDNRLALGAPDGTITIFDYDPEAKTLSVSQDDITLIMTLKK